MSVARALAPLAILAPLLVGASCSSAGSTPCVFCDAGKADQPVDRAEDFPAWETDPADETAAEAASGPADVAAGEAWRPATRDTPAGEAPQLTPVLDGGYVLADDFESGEAAGWKVLGAQGLGAYPGDWSVIEGDSGSVFAQGMLDADAWHIAYATAAIGPDQIIEAKLRVVDFLAEAPSYMAALFGRYDPTSDSGYLLALRGDGSVIVRKRDHGTSASWGGGSERAIRPGVWYTVRLEIMGGALNAFLDGTPVYSVVDDSPLPAGGIALGSFGATMEIDRVFAARP
jgi:hypothetical protein